MFTAKNAPKTPSPNAEAPPLTDAQKAAATAKLEQLLIEADSDHNRYLSRDEMNALLKQLGVTDAMRTARIDYELAAQGAKYSTQSYRHLMPEILKEHGKLQLLYNETKQLPDRFTVEDKAIFTGDTLMIYLKAQPAFRQIDILKPLEQMLPKGGDSIMLSDLCKESQQFTCTAPDHGIVGVFVKKGQEL